MNRSLICALLAVVGLHAADSGNVERWGRFEVTLKAPISGNPYIGPGVGADFTFEHRTVTVDGFYDGDGTWRVRFMPDTIGTWTYITHSEIAALNGKTGQFNCVKPAAGNHGPVAVSHVYHFAYADGTAYSPIGTTSYAWIHQGDQLEELTLATLKTAPFNKIRSPSPPHIFSKSKRTPEMRSPFRFPAPPPHTRNPGRNPRGFVNTSSATALHRPRESRHSTETHWPA